MNDEYIPIAVRWPRDVRMALVLSLNHWQKNYRRMKKSPVLIKDRENRCWTDPRGRILGHYGEEHCHLCRMFEEINTKTFVGNCFGCPLALVGHACARRRSVYQSVMYARKRCEILKAIERMILKLKYLLGRKI